MKDIFKTFKENKRITEENKILKAQVDALTKFKESFENYYNETSGVKVIARNYCNKVVLNAAFTLDDRSVYCPTDRCKYEIIDEISEQLEPFIEFDMVDNHATGTKDLVGRLTVLTK